MPALATPRLRLVPVTLEAIEAVLDHDKRRAEDIVGAAFPDQWPNDDLVALGFPYSREALRADPDTRLWGDSLVLLANEPRIIGSVVFHGRPAHGVAEIAYTIEERSRRQGYAIEAVRACVDWALSDPAIAAVQATTFTWHDASLGVIRRLGMSHVGAREHETMGELLVFELRRG